MAEPKKYYWIKLKEDFFDNDTIQFIEEQENGIKYVNFYLKLCLKSIRNEGKLIRFVGECMIPYDAPSLAKLTNMDIDTVRIAMELFKKIGVVTVLESGEIYLNQIKEMIGSETNKAELMRKKRAQEKTIGNNVTELLPDCYTEIEIEKEKDIEIDKELEKENSNSYLNEERENEKNIFSEIENNFGRIITPFEYESINAWLKHFNEEIILEAIKIATLSNIRNFKYVNGILNNWKSTGFKTLSEIQNYQNQASKEIESAVNETTNESIDSSILEFDWLNAEEVKAR